MKARCLCLVAMWVWLVVTVSGYDVPSFELGSLSSHFDKGRDEMLKIQQRAMLPTGTCWKSALEDLQMSCKSMAPENQSRLAFRFTVCYNEMLGFPFSICERKTPIQECVKTLDSNGQSTFRQFFLHTQDMCYFIEHQMWQEKTSNAVNEVTHAVIDVTKNLEEAKETQEKVLQSQQESLKVQSNIKKDNSEIYTMVLNVKDVFEDVQASAVEQRQVVVEVFEKLSRMQKLVSWIQGEMSLLDMMGFYFACMLFGFFGTSTKRTQSARFWIVFLMIMTLGSERYLYNYLIVQDNYTPELVQEFVWNLRRAAALTGVLVIVCTAAWYRDPQVVQHNMMRMVNTRLEGLSAEIKDMRKFMQENSILSIEGAKSDLNDDSDSDDTYSNYSNDSEGDFADEMEIIKQHPLPPKHEDRDGSSSNDENVIPETDPTSTNSLYLNIKNRFIKSRSREPSAEGSRHNYNLRTRNTFDTSLTASPLNETPSQFAKVIKNNHRRSSSMFYSSDED